MTSSKSATNSVTTLTDRISLELENRFSSNNFEMEDVKSSPSMSDTITSIMVDHSEPSKIENLIGVEEPLISPRTLIGSANVQNKGALDWPDEAMTITECLQLQYHKSLRHHLILLYPRDVILVDLHINQTIGVIPFEKTMSPLVQESFFRVRIPNHTILLFSYLECNICYRYQLTVRFKLLPLVIPSPPLCERGYQKRQRRREDELVVLGFAPYQPTPASRALGYLLRFSHRPVLVSGQSQ
ncbi:unnamed protein product [Nesidiocoris tenuis]|uniref:Uncharacterized protein n=1 Tax=Nesidiocoris tenuis TaxID=355587 RepID=A0A6H5HQG8_9HEMI|nr:unnamed protein product [Nesidiocoris tenuis]